MICACEPEVRLPIQLRDGFRRVYCHVMHRRGHQRGLWWTTNMLWWKAETMVHKASIQKIIWTWLIDQLAYPYLNSEQVMQHWYLDMSWCSDHCCSWGEIIIDKALLLFCSQMGVGNKYEVTLEYDGICYDLRLIERIRLLVRGRVSGNICFSVWIAYWGYTDMNDLKRCLFAMRFCYLCCQE